MTTRDNSGRFISGSVGPGKKDEVGNRYGRLVVVEIDEQRSSERPHTYWICKCDCGNVHSVEGQALRAGTIKSCGCGKYKFAKGESNFNALHRTYTRNAKKRGLVFDLTLEQFRSLVTTLV